MSPLRLPDDWVWDSWIADDGELYHLYFLKAPRALGDAGLRHSNATIGHATSSDLSTWTYLGESLAPALGGWDDLATWTGSVVRADDGGWRMFYTAISTSGHGLKDQRIFVAESDDLHTWHRRSREPVVRVDRRWYQTLDQDPEASDTWRDPFVFRDPGGDGWHMFLTARVSGARYNDDSVLAYARSSDLRTWELGPPASAAGSGFGEVEVAQVRCIDGQWVLVFTCHPQRQAPERIAAHGEFCTWSVLGDSALGPWDVAAARPFEAEPDLFAAPLVQDRSGRWSLVGFRNLEPKGTLAFDILDPIAVEVRDGALAAVAG